jgi:sugar lactone lactonase YvrE
VTSVHCFVWSSLSNAPPGDFRRLRKRVEAALALFVLVVLLCAAEKHASAQTAHFSGVQTTLGSGFANPAGTAVDASGNLYVTDLANHAVKEILAVNSSIPASPTIQTLGSGFVSPAAIAVDAKGNVYVGDQGNGTVKEMVAVNGSVPSSPSIVTLASISQTQGLALDANGDLYISGGCSGTVMAGTPCGFAEELVAVSGVVSPTSPVVVLPVSPSGPGGVAVDQSGNVYVSDTGNNRVVEVLANSGSVSASSSTRVLISLSGAIGPAGIAVDSTGDVFLSDSGTSTVSRIQAVNGSIPNVIPSNLIRTIGMGFNTPGGVALDPNGNVYVADILNNRVVEVSPSIAQFGLVNVGSTSSPISLIFSFDSSGTIGTTAVLTEGATGLDFADAGAGSCRANTAYAAGQTCTLDVSFTPRFSGDRYGAAVLQASGGSVFATGYVGGMGSGPQVNFLPDTQSSLGSGFLQPWGVAVDGSGNVFVADTNNHRVEELVAVNGSIPASPTTNVIGVAGGNPTRVRVDSAGNAYVTDSINNSVYEILKAGGYATNVTIGGGFSGPSGIAVDGSGNVFVADYGNNALKEIPPGCVLATCVTTLGSGFDGPFSVAVDSSENLYVADTNNHAVKQILSAGGYTTINTLYTGITFAGGLAVDGEGDVFVSDTINNAVLEILKTGGYTTVNTVPGTFNLPYGLAVTGSGNLLVANTGDNQITLQDFFDPPSLSFSSTTYGSVSANSPQTVTVENVGNAALTLPTSATGGDPSITAGFTVNGSGGTACGAGMIAPGASCQLAISFTPVSVGTVTGSLVLTDNTLNAASPGYATQTIGLSGTALPNVPTVTVNAVSIMVGTATANLTASVAYAGNGSPPTGGMKFQVDSGATVVATCSGSSSPLTCTYTGYNTSALAAGTHTLTAISNADQNYAAATGTNSLTVLSSSAVGNVWLGNGNGSLSAFGLNGTAVSTAGGYSGGGVGSIAGPQGLAFDGSGDLWVASTNGVSEFNPTGAAITSSAYTIGGVNAPLAIAVDGAGQIWIANTNGSVSVLLNTGSAESPATGYNGPGSTPAGIAVDISGSVWVPSKTGNSVTRILGVAAPVVPLATGAANGQGVKP